MSRLYLRAKVARSSHCTSCGDRRQARWLKSDRFRHGHLMTLVFLCRHPGIKRCRFFFSQCSRYDPGVNRCSTPGTRTPYPTQGLRLNRTMPPMMPGTAKIEDRSAE